ncbi:DUF2809 domain-containing protein [Clostridium neuense]|uniref:DUF2809 domain-containing protein n=1 Tax=Clostridium neuense TaxID=1728934 RepID=A0ABW8TF16_9CLOT
MRYKRNRIIYSLIVIVIIVLGIFSKKTHTFIPTFFNDSIGDSLWAAMIFFGFGFVFDTMKTGKVALGSILFCYIIEFSQIYHAGWIDNIRNTTLGKLVLGYTFSWNDLIAYALGIGAAIILEMLLKKCSSLYV